jgi:hypothetical protein
MSRLEAWMLAVGLIILGIAVARAGDVVLDSMFGSAYEAPENINM